MFQSTRGGLWAAMAVALALLAAAAPGSANEGEPRYCTAVVEGLAAQPDQSHFPMNTPQKRRLVNEAIRESNRWMRKAYLLAKADGHITAAKGLYWFGRDWVGNQQAHREFTVGDKQVERDCGVGLF